MKIIRQRDWKDCGVCSLLSIIEYYNGYVPLEQLRIDTNVSESGTTALDLILASKKYGFDAVGVKCKFLSDIKKLPAIAHLNLKKGLTHYVVIYKITKNKIYLMDPAHGKVVKNIIDFEKEWSKVVLLFYPHQKITLLKKKNTLIDIFFKIIVSEKRLVIMILIFSILFTLLTILGGYYFQIMGNSINNNFELNSLKIIAMLFGIFLILKLLFSYFRSYLENHLNKNIDCILNADFLNHLYHLPLNVLTSRKTGEIVTRVSELANVKTLVTDLFISFSLDFVLMLVTLPLLLFINKTLFLILFIAICLYLITGSIFSKLFYKKAYRNIEYEAEFNNNLIEDMNMIESINNLNIKDHQLKKIEKSLTRYLYDVFLLNKFLLNERSIKEVIYEISFFAINTIGFYFVWQNKMKIIDLVTFNTLLGFCFDPLKNMVDIMPKYNFLKATITKLNDFLSVDTLKLGKTTHLDNMLIEVNNLCYTYNQNYYIFKNINFTILPNTFVMIKGKSGSGKSTFCKMLNKYITDYEGSINIGGININDLSVNTIRNHILYVNQQEAIFTGTIRENITLDMDYDENKFHHICKICAVDKIVENKVLRYETGISNEAFNISGGEKNRIILARALMRDFKILVLDEALSEVDYKLEAKIIKALKKEFFNKTIIYITHKKQDKLFDHVIELERNNYELS